MAGRKVVNVAGILQVNKFHATLHVSLSVTVIRAAVSCHGRLPTGGVSGCILSSEGKLIQEAIEHNCWPVTCLFF